MKGNKSNYFHTMNKINHNEHKFLYYLFIIRKILMDSFVNINYYIELNFNNKMYNFSFVYNNFSKDIHIISRYHFKYKILNYKININF